MPHGTSRADHPVDVLSQEERTIHAWEVQYPETWLLLEITAEDEGEPLRGRLLATAEDPDDLQTMWKTFRGQGLLTMLTYGRLREPRPEVVVSAT